jgi:hypothetical protein
MIAASATPELAPELLAALVERVARPDFPRFEAQLRSSGYCARPVRLRGEVNRADGSVFSTLSEPGGVLRKACGNRREAVCPPCAERYRFDAFQLMPPACAAARAFPRQ